MEMALMTYLLELMSSLIMQELLMWCLAHLKDLRPSTLRLTSLSLLQQGFKITSSPDDHLGASVSNAGDINGDGINDIVIGTFQASLSTGVVYVIFGKNGAVTDLNLGTTDLATTHKGIQNCRETWR